MSDDRTGYVRRVDPAVFTAEPGRLNDRVYDRGSGAKACSVFCVRTPPGGGTPVGLHTHDVDQLFYVLEGTMRVEIEGIEHEVGPRTLVIFPARVPHRSWTVGDVPTVHLAIVAPLPAEGVPFAAAVPQASGAHAEPSAH